MTIYNISIITSTGYPYYTKDVKILPQGIKLYLRFYDFTDSESLDRESLSQSRSFELNAGLISALFEFARNLDKKINTLEFFSQTEEEISLLPADKKKYEGDAIITVQTEPYLINRSVQQKVQFIYDNIICSKVPLEAADTLLPEEEKAIVDILIDEKAKAHIYKHRAELKILGDDFLKNMKDYGLKGICITSFDLTPLVNFGSYSDKDIETILRNIGDIPEITPLEWAYRLSFLKNEQVWVYVVNSSSGVTEGKTLFEPFYYLLFTDAQSYLGEFPAKLTSEFNLVLG